MKSFTAILEETLQTPYADAGRDHRLSAGVFLPSDDAPPLPPGSAAERTQAIYRELMDDADEAVEITASALAPAPRRQARRTPDAASARALNPMAELEALRPKVAAAHSQTELAALRRDFARRHHPDVAPPNVASASARAMREANALIDAAARRLG